MNRTNVSNVLVIGSGAAGLRAAIAVYRSRSEVVVVGMCLRKDTRTVLAAGDINAALGTIDPEGYWQQHFSDTEEWAEDDGEVDVAGKLLE
jgi:succinate dehydrogenase flavoprotein subunit